MFQNENYWKSCYAHLHGFDVVFSTKMNFTGTAKYHGPAPKGKDGAFVASWYSEDNMWAWWSDIQNYLFSGKYDYVFMMGADVLVQYYWFDWPVWAWDRGHDISVMDQDHFSYHLAYGLNENNILLRPTNFTKDFILEAFEFRKGFHLQGDNGPYMETILRTLGRIAASEGRMGYYEMCYQWLTLPKPSVMMLNDLWWGNRNDQYDACFFNELERLVGGYGYRKTRGIGFYPTYIGFDGDALVPENFKNESPPKVPKEHPHSSIVPLGPWANCWSSVRLSWKRPDYNCFAYHWNGPKDPSQHSVVSGGKCPDPTFNWDTNPYNPANRR